MIRVYTYMGMISVGKNLLFRKSVEGSLRIYFLGPSLCIVGHLTSLNLASSTGTGRNSLDLIEIA